MTITEIRKAIQIAERERDTNPCPAYKDRCDQHVAWLKSQLHA